ncbi:hypothetical protein ACM66B_003811 [Microbotryomycetes sp. NB124-2]
MRRLLWAAALICASTVTAAPACEPTRAPVVNKRDVNIGIQIGAVSTVTLERTKTLRKTATVTTEIEGRPTVVPTVVETETTMTLVSTATAFKTEIETQTVIEGKTVPVTLTTTAYDVELATQMVTIPHTTTYYTQEVKVVTVQGQPITSTVSVLTTELPTTKLKPRPTQDEPAPDNRPQEDKLDETEKEAKPKDKAEQDLEQNDEDEEGPPKKDKPEEKPRPKETTATAIITSLATSTNAQGVTSVSTVLLPTTIINNDAQAESNSTSGADAVADSSSDSTNTNQNSVEIWMQEGNNKTYVIVGAVVAGLCLIGIIVAVVMGSHKSSTVVSYGPSYDRNGSSVSQGQPSTVAASMSRRPRFQERRKYARVEDASSDERESSDMEQISRHEQDQLAAAVIEYGQTDVWRMCLGVGWLLRRALQ